MTVAIIEDGLKPKAADDPTLSPEAQRIVKQVSQAHKRWIEIATWGRETLAKGKDSISLKEGMALLAYEGLRKKLTWPLWSTKMDSVAIEGQIFAIQATWQRIKRSVPDAFEPKDAI